MIPLLFYIDKVGTLLTYEEVDWWLVTLLRPLLRPEVTSAYVVAMLTHYHTACCEEIFITKASRFTENHSLL